MQVEIMMTSTTALTVMIVEDSRPVRARLKSLLNEIPGVSVVAETSQVAAAMDELEVRCPAVVVVDIDLPDGTGMDLLRFIRQRRLACVPMVLTNYNQPEFRHCCTALGARYYFDKAHEFDQIAQTLAAMASGSSHSPPSTSPFVLP